MSVAFFTAWPQSFVPSDAAHLPPRELLPLLQLVCPGHADASGCETCPRGTTINNGRWDLQSVIFGHFASPSSDDLLLSGIGCETHADGLGGSYLLTRTKGSWQPVNYAAGRLASDCKKISGSDNRDRLICGDMDQHAGVRDSFLYLLDPGRFRNDQGLALFLDVADSLGSCVAVDESDGKFVLVGEIERVTVESPKISVDVSLGKAIIPETVLSNCGEPRLKIRTERRRFTFLFDGYGVGPAPANPPMNGFEPEVPVTDK